MTTTGSPEELEDAVLQQGWPIPQAQLNPDSWLASDLPSEELKIWR